MSTETRSSVQDDTLLAAVIVVILFAVAATAGGLAIYSALQPKHQPAATAVFGGLAIFAALFGTTVRTVMVGNKIASSTKDH